MNCNKPVQTELEIKPQHKIILDYLKTNPFITCEIVRILLSVKQARAYAVMREMVKRGLIHKDIFHQKQYRTTLASQFWNQHLNKCEEKET